MQHAHTRVGFERVYNGSLKSTLKVGQKLPVRNQSSFATKVFRRWRSHLIRLDLELQSLEKGEEDHSSILLPNAHPTHPHTRAHRDCTGPDTSAKIEQWYSTWSSSKLST